MPISTNDVKVDVDEEVGLCGRIDGTHELVGQRCHLCPRLGTRLNNLDIKFAQNRDEDIIAKSGPIEATVVVICDNISDLKNAFIETLMIFVDINGSVEDNDWHNLTLLDKAVDTRCGHTFCHECLNQWLSRPQTTKECPECRQPLASRKRSRSQTIGDNSLVIGGNVLVEKNRRINEMIGKLKIRCDYEWNGCPEVCPLESLSTHLKTCQHKLCQTCGLSVNPISDDHNCIEDMKRDRNEWQKKCNEWTQRAQELETEVKDFEEKSMDFELKYKTNTNKWQKKCNSLTQKTKELEIKLKVSEEMALDLESKYKQTKNPSEHLIIIELNEAMKEIFLFQLRKKCCNNRKFEYKTIDSKTAQHMLSRAKIPIIESTKS
ncbi:unnamed protein product [Medioppia subpectinata]|uniref:RING-type domain-containing protein n=1 Tax=Medioppia subpectinata TaxID=1979941 RepID=A0A7R9KLK4_9ACAR|nr:unnamed protein product [Medioppia subpectinata]CAG2104729.1 unnamed protein product [Medioppia subpectinata]